jgi:hypothetical protein
MMMMMMMVYFIMLLIYSAVDVLNGARQNQAHQHSINV